MYTNNVVIRRLEDGGGRGAAEAAGRVEGVDSEELVHEAAGDAHHGGAAVLALGVELEGLGLRVVVAHPRNAGNVASLLVVGLRLGEGGRAGLLHAREEHDLEPSEGRDGLERREAAGRHVGELDAERGRQVSGEADARLDGDDVEEAEHGRAAVLDLHDLRGGGSVRSVYRPAAGQWRRSGLAAKGAARTS